MTSSRPSSPPRVVLRAALVAALLGTACKEDPPPGKLFDEDGAYELVQYNLEGDGYVEVVMPGVTERDEAFLMTLDASARVAQVAMCAENDMQDPSDAQCRTAGDNSFWFCQCFAYAFVKSQMQWRQFQPGDVPPQVSFTGDDGGSTPPTSDSATGGSGSGGGETGAVDPAADTIIDLAEIPGVQGEYEFAPLPIGVFGSDGLVSRYRFQQRAPSIFDQVIVEDPDGRPTCQPCVP